MTLLNGLGSFMVEAPLQLLPANFKMKSDEIFGIHMAATGYQNDIKTHYW
jgi:hypothetical protein